MAESTSIKLRDGYRERLKALAKSKDTTSSQLINDAVREYVDRAERRIAFLDEARERWDHYKATGERISMDEADAWIDELLASEDAPPAGRRG